MLQDCKDHCALTGIHLCSQDFGEAPVAVLTGWGTSITKTEDLNTCAKFLFFLFDKPVKKELFWGSDCRLINDLCLFILGSFIPFMVTGRQLEPAPSI